MKSSPSEVLDQEVSGRIDEFMGRFRMGTLLSRAGIRKVRRSIPLLILRTIFDLALFVYTGVHNCPTAR
ncbi:MAG: hypothetical protein RDU20_19765 [Desulfomonilaceae bacterium]|nr:hypothetical protein [Desulfomonilaceae bacterium]